MIQPRDLRYDFKEVHHIFFNDSTDYVYFNIIVDQDSDKEKRLTFMYEKCLDFIGGKANNYDDKGNVVYDLEENDFIFTTFQKRSISDDSEEHCAKKIRVDTPIAYNTPLTTDNSNNNNNSNVNVTIDFDPVYECSTPPTFDYDNEDAQNPDDIDNPTFPPLDITTIYDRLADEVEKEFAEMPELTEKHFIDLEPGDVMCIMRQFYKIIDDEYCYHFVEAEDLGANDSPKIRIDSLLKGDYVDVMVDGPTSSNQTDYVNLSNDNESNDITNEPCNSPSSVTSEDDDVYKVVPGEEVNEGDLLELDHSSGKKYRAIVQENDLADKCVKVFNLITHKEHYFFYPSQIQNFTVLLK